MLPFALPPGHFLSLPPSFAQPDCPSSSNTASHAADGLAPNVASLAAADYDVDVRTGFLPGTNNVTRLPSDWDLWEDALSAARGEGVGQGLRLRGTGTKDQLWRQGIESVSSSNCADCKAKDRCRRCPYPPHRYPSCVEVILCSPFFSISTLTLLLNRPLLYPFRHPSRSPLSLHPNILAFLQS